MIRNSVNDHPTWKNLTWRAMLSQLLRPLLQHDIRSSIIPHTWHCWRAWQLNIDWWIRGPCTSLASDECSRIILCFLTLYIYFLSPLLIRVIWSRSLFPFFSFTYFTEFFLFLFLSIGRLDSSVLWDYFSAAECRIV